MPSACVIVEGKGRPPYHFRRAAHGRHHPHPLPDPEARIPTRPLRRVALIVPSLRGGGLERVVRDQALGLARGARYTPGVFATGGLGVNAEALEQAGIPVHDSRPTGRRIRGVNTTLVAQLRAFGPDVIHAHSGCWLPAVVATLALRRPRLVFTDHGRYPPEPLHRRILERFLHGRTDQLVTVSQALAEYDRKWLGLATPPLTIPNGLDLTPPPALSPAGREAQRATLGAGPGDCLAVAVGRLVPVKDHATLLEAVAQVRQQGLPLRLALIGAGPLEADLRARAESLGVLQAVSFAGFRTDIPACLQAADLWVCSSTTEGLPIALLEAMAAGCPILSTAVGGIPDALGGGEAGELVPHSNSSAMASRLVDLVRSPERREELGARARARAAGYSLATMVEAYEALYDRLLDGARS